MSQPLDSLKENITILLWFFMFSFYTQRYRCNFFWIIIINPLEWYFIWCVLEYVVLSNSFWKICCLNNSIMGTIHLYNICLCLLQGWVVLSDKLGAIELARVHATQIRWGARLIDLQNGSDQRLLICQKPFLTKWLIKEGSEGVKTVDLYTVFYLVISLIIHQNIVYDSLSMEIVHVEACV